jgi:uncharacterized protein YjbI with pentapeptide repeats
MREMDLQGAKGAISAFANLSGITLTGASLKDANLTGAKFGGADRTGAKSER